MLCVTCKADVPVVFDSDHDCISVSCSTCGTYKIEDPTDDQKVESFKNLCIEALGSLITTSVASVARYRFIKESLSLEEPLEVQRMFGDTLHFYSLRVQEASEFVDATNINEAGIMLNALSQTIDEMVHDQRLLVSGLANATGKKPPALCFVDDE